MTIASLLPRLGGNGTHVRDENARLKRTVTKLQRWQQQANDYFQRLTADRADVYACWEAEVQRRVEAEIVAACIQTERDEWRDRFLALQARFGPQLAAEANRNRVTVPPMVRPIDGPQDEATAPIDVRPLWDALGVGPTTAVTDPGQVR